MFSSQITQEGLLGFRSVYQRMAIHIFHASLAFALLAVSWLLWRIWTFTILPALRPHEPKEVPYLMPCESTSIIFTLRVLKKSSSTVIGDYGPQVHDILDDN